MFLARASSFACSWRGLIAESLATETSIGPMDVVDEFTSVVDRTVAKIGSAAVARTIRKKKLQFVAVSCHEDVEEWLQPDWVYRPAEQRFVWRFLQRRPSIHLEVVRCQASAWPLFAPHHYLSGELAWLGHLLFWLCGAPTGAKSVSRWLSRRGCRSLAPVRRRGASIAP